MGKPRIRARTNPDGVTNYWLGGYHIGCSYWYNGEWIKSPVLEFFTKKIC